MALTINTNLFSLNTQRNLRNAQDPLATAMQRLSSGLRINSARDDAAGLAIATRMQRQATGLSVAMRNANDGISFAQTAEGAETEMVNSLQRIYELSNQAASYNTSTDRTSMNQEVTQLIAELNRVVSQTRFNGEQFLNKAFSGAFQVGTEVNETISISTSNVSPTNYGVQSTRTDFGDTAANRDSIASAMALMNLRQTNGLSASATLAGVNMGNAISFSDTLNNTLNIINRVNQYTGQTNVTAFSFGNSLTASTYVAGADGGIGLGSNGISSGYLTINGIQIGSSAVTDSSGGAVASALVTVINAKSTQTGVYATILGSADTGVSSGYSVTLVNTTGAAISVSVSTSAISTSVGANLFGASGSTVAAGQNGQIVFSTPLGTTTVSTTGASDTWALGFTVASTVNSVSVSGRQSVNDVTISTVGGANLSILAVKQGLETLNTEKAKLGAVLNRFSSTLRNIDNVRENINAAKSRIMDADFASETANLTKAMITQQAGISVLAQANQIPQQVLALLGGR